MTDSSLTTSSPHLKRATHMGGLAVSGSHGLREYTEMSPIAQKLTQDAMLVPDCTLSSPLKL